MFRLTSLRQKYFYWFTSFAISYSKFYSDFISIQENVFSIGQIQELHLIPFQKEENQKTGKGAAKTTPKRREKQNAKWRQATSIQHNLVVASKFSEPEQRWRSTVLAVRCQATEIQKRKTEKEE